MKPFSLHGGGVGERTLSFWLLSILLLATATRFHALDTRSLWEDEGWTLLLSRGSIGQIVETMAYDQHPPLYFVMFGLWHDVTGNSEFAIRTFSVFTGILSTAAMYQLGKTLFNGDAGLFAAVLFAVWDFAIDIAQDARQYGLLTLFVLLACIFYFRYLKSPTRAHGVYWFIFSVLALYTQYVAGVVLAIQALHWLLIFRQRILDGMIRFGLMGLAFSIWGIVFIHQNQVRWDYPIFYQSGLPNNQETFILIRDALITQQFGLIIGLFLLGSIFMTYTPRFKINIRPSGSIIFLLLWTILYIGLFVYLNESREILRIRIFAIALPPILLLVAHGLTNLQPVPQFFLITVLLGVNLTTIDSRQNNPPWREVTRNITNLHQADELVLMDIWVGDFPARYYIDRQMDTEWVSLRELREEKRDFFLPELKALLENRTAFWLMRWNDDPAEYDALLAEMGFQRTASPYVAHVGNKLYSHRYDRLSDDPLATFGESLTLIKANAEGEIQAGNRLKITLWWAASQPLPVDYSISVFLMDENGTMLALRDKPPLTPTSAWLPDVIHFDQHELPLPENLPDGELTLGVRVYWYVEPEQPLAVKSDRVGVANETFAVIGKE